MSAARGTLTQVASTAVSPQRLRDLALVRRVRDRIDRESPYGYQTADAEVVQEPTEQPYGIRYYAVRDPAGNLVRIQEVR